MNFTTLNTYGDAPDQAFEALCNQLFDHWVEATYAGQVRHFAVVNGAGGDGGVEVYAELTTGKAIGLQAKWFLEPLESSQISQIRESVKMAQRVRPHLERYIVCVPRDLQSIKIGRGDKPIRNAEDKRVEDLLTELEGAYPNLTVEFWTEHQLRELLQQPENDGVHRFWFNKEELSPATITLQFELARAGWLRERYSPDLHAYGVIQQEIDKLLLTPNYRAAAHQQVVERATLVAEAVQLLDDFERKAGASPKVNTASQLLRGYLHSQQQQLQQVFQALLLADSSLTLPTVSRVEMWPVLEKLDEGGFSNLVLGIVQRLKEVLQQLGNVGIHDYAASLQSALQPHNLLIFGRPGTGKTHGVARAVEQRLEDGYPALIISARRAPATNWHAILTHTLDGFTDWTAPQLFAALGAMAARVDVKRARTAVTTQALQNETTQVLICLDGVDEAPAPEPWRERVNELHVFLAKYPRLRFVVTSRAYPPANVNPCGLEHDEVINRRLDLPHEGDVPLAELASKYLQHYRIDYSSTPWLPEAFHDALTIRLFAIQYAGQDLATLAEPITTSLGGLLSYKINQIEAEFTANPKLAFPASLHLAQMGLLSISQALQAHSSIEHDALCQQIVDDLKGRVGLNEATRMLEIYANHGLILQQEGPRPSRFAPPTQLVSFAFQQPLVDYLLASEATDYIAKSGDKRVPQSLLRRRDRNALYLTATALLTDNRILVGQDGYWVGEIDAAQLADMQYVALANAPADVVAEYLPKAIAEFQQGTRERNIILEEFVLPNAYRTDIEIVRPLIHDVLTSYPTVFARDLFWSGPAAREDTKERNIGHILGEQHLHTHDAVTGFPLLFAWSLATVNNTYREHARRELTRWGSANPAAFVELLELVFDAGDPQMQEDLAVIMLGVMSLLTQPSAGGQQLAGWIMGNVFASERITNLLNSVVRAHARAAVERAVALGDWPEADSEAARPPYATDSALLPLKLRDAQGAGRETMNHRGKDERFPIVHDLAWYVLEKSYRGFLDLPTAGRSRKGIRGFSLLEEYEKQHQAKITTYDFAMSAALAYIETLGYNRTTGPGTTQATHGSLSKTSTLEEKYTWLAVHHLQGYLADRLPYERNGEDHQLVGNYRLFMQIDNPATELGGTTEGEVAWYVPVELSPEVQAGTEEDIVVRMQAWASREDNPDFSTWLELPGLIPAAVANEPEPRAWLPLFAEIRLPEREGRGTTVLMMCCVWVPQADWDAIQDSYAGNMRQLAIDNFSDFDDVDSWQSRPEGDTYASVKDVVLSPNLEEDGATTELYGPNGEEWVAYNTIATVLEHTVGDGETTYLIPSNLVRQHLNITDTNRQAFRNQQGQTVACYQDINENYDPSEELLVVDRQLFMEASSQHQLRPFWLVSQFQKTTPDFSEKFAGSHTQNFRQWIVWKEEELHAQLFYRNWFKGQKEGKLDGAAEGEEMVQED
jgi:hypothetical protein